MADEKVLCPCGLARVCEYRSADDICMAEHMTDTFVPLGPSLLLSPCDYCKHTIAWDECNK